MFRKLEPKVRKNLEPPRKFSFGCSCQCEGIAVRGEQAMPKEDSMRAQIGVHFVVKG